MDKKTALIIGAGPAGLTAALELLKRSDIQPIVVESGDWIGGIARTIEHHGNRMDIGGHRFFSKDETITNLWQELLPVQGHPAKDDLLINRQVNLTSGGPDPESDDLVILKRRRVSRIFYLRKFFDYPLSIKFETFANLGFINTLKAGFGYLSSLIFKRKEKSLEDFLINRFGKPLYKMFFEDYTEKVWGIHPQLIAPDWGAQRIKGLSLMKALATILMKPFRKNSKKVETSLIEEFYYPKLGPGQLYEHMAFLIKEQGGQVLLNHEVTKIKINKNNITNVTILTPEGTINLTPDYVISSMPIKDLLMAAEASVKDTEVLAIAKGLVYRDFITVGLLLPSLKIKNKTKLKTVSNIVPDCWIYIQEKDVKVGRLQIFNNWSPYMVNDLENSVWVGLEYFVNEGDAMWNMDQDGFINMAINELVTIGIIEDASIVKDTVQVKVKKAYPAYFGTYDQFDQVKTYLNGIDNLYCIGRNGQHRYNNMDHSMLTAIVAVSSILNPSETPKDLVWSVNTEKSYHENKKEK